MKKAFVTPKIEWMMIDAQDILTVSGRNEAGALSNEQIVDLSGKV